MRTQEIAGLVYRAVSEFEGAYASPRVCAEIRDRFIELARAELHVDLTRFRKKIRIKITAGGLVDIQMPPKALTYPALH